MNEGSGLRVGCFVLIINIVSDVHAGSAKSDCCDFSSAGKVRLFSGVIGWNWMYRQHNNRHGKNSIEIALFCATLFAPFARASISADRLYPCRF